MKYFRKVCTHDQVIAVVNTDKEKYLKYETNTSGKRIGNVCVRFHDSERLYSFELLKKITITDDGCSRISSLEMIALKENANIRLLVDD